MKPNTNITVENLCVDDLKKVCELYLDVTGIWINLDKLSVEQIKAELKRRGCVEVNVTICDKLMIHTALRRDGCNIIFSYDTNQFPRTHCYTNLKNKFNRAVTEVFLNGKR